MVNSGKKDTCLATEKMLIEDCAKVKKTIGANFVCIPAETDGEEGVVATVGPTVTTAGASSDGGVVGGALGFIGAVGLVVAFV